MNRRLHSGIALIAIVQLCSACAIGTSRMALEHTPFEAGVAAEPRGDISVRRFVDNRAEDRREFIGAKRNGYGMVLGHIAVPVDDTLEDILTLSFTEALRSAGYRAVIEGGEEQEIPTDFAPVLSLEGSIDKFWLDMYMATWHNVIVGIELVDDTEAVVWSTSVEGSETNVLWLGLAAEFRGVVRQALDTALAAAIAEFGSEDFVAQVESAEPLHRGVPGAQDAMVESRETDPNDGARAP